MEKWSCAFLGICLISACGEIKHKTEGTVEVKVVIDFSELEKYFLPICEDEFPEATEEQIDECINNKIGEYLDSIS